MPIAYRFLVPALALSVITALSPANAQQKSLRIHGSNTIGAALMPALLERYFDFKGVLDRQWVLGAPDERVLNLRGAPDFLPGSIELHAHGSATAFESLKAGTADIGMASRRIKDSEVADLAAHGNMTSFTAENVLALDGVAVFVNQENPVSSLTIDQIGKIFTGEITSWKAVGGPDQPIKLFIRAPGSGTRDTFESLAMGGKKFAASAVAIEDSAMLSDAVASDPNAIGFTGLAYIRNAKPLSIDECGIQYPPLDFYIKTEEYPLARRLFLYTLPDHPSRTVSEMIDYWLSNAGQETMAKEGFINLIAGVEPNDIQLERLRLKAADTGASADTLKAYFADATTTKRMTFTFRFENNSDQLDNRSILDLQRLTQFLAEPANKDRKILIVGFSDGRGSKAANLKLSANRASMVADTLRKKGVNPLKVTQFGADFPVACNTTDAGRSKNRRVEVWLR